MPYELFLAVRYLRARRGRRVVKLTALAAVAGIAFGVAALIVALALAGGFREELRDKILRGTAHVTVTRADGAAMRDWREVAARLRTIEGVTDAAPTGYEGALLSGARGAVYTIVRGVDADSARALSELRRTMVEGDAGELFRVEPESVARAGVDDEDVEEEPPANVVVGAELAARTGLERIGDEGWLVTGERSPTPPGFSPRARRARVVGLFRTGLYDYDASWTYVSLAESSRFFHEDDDGGATTAAAASVLSVETQDIYEASEVAARVRHMLGASFRVVDWREANRPLFAALELERRTVALIILLITIVAALNITTTLALVVVERRADIAVLVALGARARSIVAVFMLEGALIGVVGAVAGIVCGLIACAAAEYFGLVRLPPDVYSLSSVPLRPHARDVLLPALAAFVVSLLATLYPARAAARVRPAEALRYE
ncbi:MAG TPA: ABC transporter permease [Pyrinomonadaceae bacterium]|nr:ABC transporter permease [Pyrinomonadaceae bacterium]